MMSPASIRRRVTAATFGFAVLVGASAAPAPAQEVTLRFASFPGPTNFLNTGLFGPWFKKCK